MGIQEEIDRIRAGERELRDVLRSFSSTVPPKGDGAYVWDFEETDAGRYLAALELAVETIRVMRYDYRGRVSSEVREYCRDALVAIEGRLTG